MRYDLSPEQESMRDSVRRFLEKRAPLPEIRKSYDSPGGFSPESWRDFVQLGWTGLVLPEALGGFTASGHSARDLAIFAEEMGRLVAAGPFLPAVVCLDALARSEDVNAHGALIQKIAEGEALVAWAFGESGDRWSAEALQTRAEKDRAGFVLNGAKAYVEAGAEAEAFLVTARCGAGLIQLLAPRGADGVSVVPGRSVDFVRRFAQVRFDNVRLPLAAVVTDQARAQAQVERQYQLALLLLCAETNGALERAFEFTVDYMRERYAFGRPIASYQALKHRLADMLLRLHSCMATTDAAIDAFDFDAPDAGKLARIAKTYVGAKSTASAGDLVQLTGGLAVTWEYDMHLYERRIAVNRAVFGGPERHRAYVHRMISA